jgi:hypothetical protein
LDLVRDNNVRSAALFCGITVDWAVESKRYLRVMREVTLQLLVVEYDVVYSYCTVQLYCIHCESYRKKNGSSSDGNVRLVTENTLRVVILDTPGMYMSYVTTLDRTLDRISIVKGQTGGNVWFPKAG